MGRMSHVCPKSRTAGQSCYRELAGWVDTEVSHIIKSEKPPGSAGSGRLCSLMVRVQGYTSIAPGFNPGPHQIF
jgi:hypothetical protein